MDSIYSKLKKRTLQHINIIEETLGYGIDKDVGILQTRHYIQLEMSTDEVRELLETMIINNLKELATLFIYIICKTKIIPFDKKWLTTQTYLRGYKDKKENGKSKANLIDFYGLSYKNNSCYMDSTIFAMFVFPNELINHYFLESKEKDDCTRQLQTELRLITAFMRFNEDKDDEINCTSMRKILKKCNDTPQPFYETGTQDAGEFLLYLFDKFKFTIATRHELTYGSTNGIDYEFLNKTELKTDPVIQIVSTDLIKMSSSTEYSLCHFIKQDDTAELDKDNLFRKIYSHRKQITFLVSPYVVFRVQRLGYKNKKQTFFETKLIPAQVLFMPSKDNMYSTLCLSAIVLHNGLLKGPAHYTCVIKKGDLWYYYNDVSDERIEFIGTYKDMLQIKPNPITHGILYFYN